MVKKIVHILGATQRRCWSRPRGRNCSYLFGSQGRDSLGNIAYCSTGQTRLRSVYDIRPKFSGVAR